MIPAAWKARALGREAGGAPLPGPLDGRALRDHTHLMKTILFALVFLAPVAVSADPQALDQLQECAAGHCWDTKGQPVTAPAPGSVLVLEPRHIQPAGSLKPAEPPRYTVLSKEEVDAARRRNDAVGTALGAAMGGFVGATIGGMIGGPLGAVALGLIGAGIGYAAFRLMRR